jgi:iron(III) transport system permease protein
MKLRNIDITRGVPLLVLGAAVAVFCVWPLALMCAKSVDGGPSAAAARWAEVLGSSLPHLGNSVFVAVLASAMSCAIGLAVALCIAYGPAKLRACLTGMTMVSMVSPPFIASLAYIQLFGKRGLITHDLLGLTISPYGWLGIVVMQGLFFAPLTILMLQATLRRIDTRQYRAAEDLGAGPSRVLGTVTLPLVGPTLAACFLLTFVRSMSDYGTPIIMGGPFETISSQIYVQLIGYSDLPGVAVLDVVLLVIAAVVFYLRKRLDDKTEQLVGGSGVQDAEEEWPKRSRAPTSSSWCSSTTPSSARPSSQASASARASRSSTSSTCSNST